MPWLTRNDGLGSRRNISITARKPSVLELIAQLDVPVCQIDEVLPEIMLRRSKGDLNEWSPLRPLGFADQAHVRLARKPVAFARIARNTRANHVFPSRRPAPVARHDVIEIKITAIE